MKKKLSVLVIVGLAVSAISLSACAENQAATAKCKESPSSDTCSKCCTEAKSNGHSFTGAGTCTCRGGG